MTLMKTASCVGAALLAFTLPAFAQDIAHGNGALELFDAEGMAASPAWVRYWIMVMMATFVIGIVFAIRQVQARWVMAWIASGFVTMGILTRGFGWPELSGFIALLHLLFWTPALIILLRNRTFLKDRSLFGYWTGLITFVILFSFIFDIRDAAIYLDHVMGIGLLS